MTEAQLASALEEQRNSGWKLGSILVARGSIEESVLATFLSMQTGMPCVDLANVFPSDAILDLLPAAVARRLRAVPIKRVGDTIHVAMSDPTDRPALAELAQATHLRVEPLIAPASALERALRSYYGEKRKAPRRSGRAAPRSSPDVAAEIQTLEHAIETLQHAVARLKRAVADRDEAG